MVRYVTEKKEGAADWTDAMDDLDECIRLAEMEDLKFMGWLYTWSNRRPENPILRKLDRVLVNETWMIGVVISVLLPQSISDYSPVESFLSLQF